MLAPRVVLDFVTAEPFRPFRMYMASGRTFEVGHPEMVKVGRSSVTVYLKPEGDSTSAERWQEVLADAARIDRTPGGPGPSGGRVTTWRK